MRRNAENPGSDDAIFDKDYLHKLIKLIRSSGTELSFAFGLDLKSPEACDLLLHRKKSGEMLFRILKKTKKFANRSLTFGTARIDADDPQTLVFQLGMGANKPPKKITQTARKLFQIDKKMRFKKLKVVTLDGETFEDDGLDDDPLEGGFEKAIKISPQQVAKAERGLDEVEVNLRRMAAELGIQLQS